MKQPISRRAVLASGAALAAATALPAGPAAAGSGPRGPRLVYSRTGFFTAIGGFPSLLAYDGGLVVTRRKPKHPSTTPWLADLHDVSPATIRSLLETVRATGVFRSGLLIAGGSGYDFDGLYIEAWIGGRRYARYDYAVTGQGETAVSAAAKVVDDFIAALDAGKPYVPAGFLLEVGAIVQPGPDDVQPVPWPLAAVAPLQPLRDGSQDRFVLPPRTLAALVKTGSAFAWNAVREGAGEARLIRWRPLYPHE